MPNVVQAAFHASNLAGLNTPSSLSATRLYEAVAQAPRIFRDNGWIEGIGRGRTAILVKVKHPETEHTVRVQELRALALKPRRARPPK